MHADAGRRAPRRSRGGRSRSRRSARPPRRRTSRRDHEQTPSRGSIVGARQTRAPARSGRRARTRAATRPGRRRRVEEAQGARAYRPRRSSRSATRGPRPRCVELTPAAGARVTMCPGAPRSPSTRPRPLWPKLSESSELSSSADVGPLRGGRRAVDATTQTSETAASTRPRPRASAIRRRSDARAQTSHRSGEPRQHEVARPASSC